jgi:hypothetical protein
VLQFNYAGSGTDYDVVWSDTITYSGAGTLVGVQVDLEDVIAVMVTGANSLRVTFPSASGSGTTWAVNSQPPEISEPLDFPEGGTTG